MEPHSSLESFQRAHDLQRETDKLGNTDILTSFLEGQEELLSACPLLSLVEGLNS